MPKTLPNLSFVSTKSLKWAKVQSDEGPGNRNRELTDRNGSRGASLVLHIRNEHLPWQNGATSCPSAEVGSPTEGVF